jgi:c-di-GMP-binding flagellar brake protein YcgR
MLQHTTATNRGSLQEYKQELVTAVLALFTNMYLGNVLKQTIVYKTSVLHITCKTNSLTLVITSQNPVCIYMHMPTHMHIEAKVHRVILC